MGMDLLNARFSLTGSKGTLIVFGLSVYLYSTWNGMGATYDSEVYLDLSFLIREKGFKAFLDEAFFAKPPLYPVVLSLIGKSWIMAFNAICLSISLLFIAIILHRSQILASYEILVFGIICFGTPILLTHNFIWTEPLFFVLLSIFLAVCQNVLFEKSKFLTLKQYTLLVIVGVLMSLTRHLGMVISGLAILYIILSTNKLNPQRKTSYIFFAALALSSWQFVQFDAFVFRLSQIFNPEIEGAYLNYPGNIGNIFSVMSRWFWPIGWGRSLLGFLGVLAFTVYIYRSRKSDFSRMLVVVALGYLVSVIIPFELEEYSYERYLLPIYLFMALLFVESVKPTTILPKKWILILLTGMLMYTTARTIKNAIFWKDVRSGIEEVQS